MAPTQNDELGGDGHGQSSNCFTLDDSHHQLFQEEQMLSSAIHSARLKRQRNVNEDDCRRTLNNADAAAVKTELEERQQQLGRNDESRLVVPDATSGGEQHGCCSSSSQVATIQPTFYGTCSNYADPTASGTGVFPSDEEPKSPPPQLPGQSALTAKDKIQAGKLVPFFFLLPPLLLLTFLL